jgi:hypothetical protein
MEKVKLLSVSPKGKFYPELIDTHFSIYSPVTEKFHQPNYYGKFSDGSGHCGSLSYFLDFEISKNGSRFFSGNGILIGYLVDNPNKLIMLNCSVYDSKKYVILRYFQPEMKFEKKPTTNQEFKMMVEDFLNEIELEFIDIVIDIVQSISSQGELVKMSNQYDDELPF